MAKLFNTRDNRAELLDSVDVEALLDELGLDYIEQRDHWKAFCPFHPDGEVPNLSVGGKHPCYNCFSCGAKGSYIDLVANIKEISIGEAFGWLTTFVENQGPVTHRKERAPDPEPEAIDESVVKEWQKNLWSDEGQHMLAYLLEQRGLSTMVVESFDLGYDLVSERITIPVYDKDDRVVNVRKYQPGARHSKVISYAKGYGRNRRLNPRSGEADYVLLCAGEMDYLVARNLGFDGADTFTAGEEYVPKPSEVEDWKDKPVYVFYDNDDAGRGGAHAIQTALGPKGFEINVVAWPPGYPEKCDLSDLVNEHGFDRAAIDNLLCVQPLPPQNEVYVTDVTPTPTGPPLVDQTDSGNATLLAHYNRGEMLWVERWKVWMVYDGTRWVRDELGAHVQRAKALTKRLIVMAASLPTQDEQNQLIRHAQDSQSLRGIKAMIELAKDEPGMSTSPEEFDVDSDLLNCQNGTLHLPTGELRPHSPEDRLTKMVRAPFDPGAPAPRWRKFFEEILPDPEVRLFLQRALGTALYGGNTDHAFYVLYSPQGRSGRSVMGEVILTVLAEYGRSTDAKTFMEAQFEGCNRDALANLVGVRYVSASETKSDRKLDIDAVKWITGADTLTVMRKYEHEFSYKPQFTIFLRTNHKPIITEINDPIWERVHLVPFTVSIPREQRDKQLEGKLNAEAEGVLAWLYEGYRAWADEGLNPPPTVVAATADYQREQDALAPFFDEVLESDSTGGVSGYLRKDALYTRYESWCRRNREEPLTPRKFYKRMDEAGYVSAPHPQGGYAAWRGVRLKGSVAQ